jgi:hypothetical protein
MSDDKKKDDYEVGYRKPPKHTRYRKGQSGNLRGRKKGSRGLKTDLGEALDTKHSITVKGKVITGTAQQLAMVTLALKAASGDARSIRLLTDLIMQLFGAGDRGDGQQRLSSTDQEFLDRITGDLATKDVSDEPSDPEPAGPKPADPLAPGAGEPAPDPDKGGDNG